MTDDGPHDIDVEAVDIDEAVNQARLNALEDARENVRERREMAQLRLAGDQYDRMGLVAFRSALETYAREAEALLRHTETGRHYWTERHFGHMIYPTDEADIRDPNPVEGLDTLFETENPATFEMETITESPGLNRGNTIETIEVEQQIPFGILDEMYATINQYLSEIGIDIELTDETNEWELEDE